MNSHDGGDRKEAVTDLTAENPRWLGYWAVFLILIAPFVYFSSETLALVITQTISLVILGVLVESGLFHTGANLSGWFFRISLLWMGMLGLSSIFSVDASISVPYFLKICGLVLVAVTIRYGINSVTCARSLFWCAGFAIAIHSVAGLSEYFRGDPMPASWIDPGMRDIIKSRAAGFFGDPNLLGCYLAALLPFCLAGYFTAGQREPFERAFWLGVIFLGGYGLLTTFSRGAYIAALAGGAVIMLSMRPSLTFTGRKKGLAFVGVILLLIFFSGPYKYRFFSIVKTSDLTLSQRALINAGILKALPSIPPLGFGPHTFNQVYPRFRVVGGDYPLYAHNEILQTLLESGPITVGVLLALCFVLVRQIYLLIRRRRGNVPWESAACAGTFVVIAVQNLSGFSARIFPIAVLLAVSVGGLLSSMVRKHEADNKWLWEFFPRKGWVLFFAVYLVLAYKSAWLQFLLADAQRALSGRLPEQAMISLARAEEIDDRIPFMNFLMSQTEELRGNASAAAEMLSKAIAINPTEALYWVFQSRQQSTRDLKQAFSSMEKAIELDPAAESFRLEYARMLASSSHFPEALAQLDEALKFSPGAQFHDVYPVYREVENLKKELLARLMIFHRPPASGSNELK